MTSGEETRAQETELAERLEEEFGLTRAMARVFAARFNGKPELAEFYLNPSLQELRGLKHSTALPAVLDTLARARRDGLAVLFYGDYDVDGVAATYILYSLAQRLGLTARYFLPSRFNEGYGLSRRIVMQAAEHRYEVLVALDCGTANVDEVSLAQEGGLEVLVLDHHQPVGKTPEVPIINPHLDEGLDPMCSASLAFSFGREWLAAEGESPAFVEEKFLEFAALGIIADVVPLVGDNFILAHFGMENLPATGNTGLQALMRVLNLQGKTFLTWRDLAFSMIPCLNAAGRMAHARHAIELFLAEDIGVAAEIALTTLKLNRQRKAQQSRIFAEAARQAELFPDSNVLVLYAPEWNQGITGIVAAKIVEAYQRPTLIFSDSSSEEGIIVGSGRAPTGCDLIATLQPARELFTELGGHAQAVGGTLPRERLGELRDALSRAELVATSDVGANGVHGYDAALRPCDIEPTLVSDLRRVYPFGEGYPPPRLVLEQARVNRILLVGYDKTHIALSISGDDGGAELRVIGFQMSHLAQSLSEGTRYNLEVELDLDSFRGELAVQFRLLGVLSEGDVELE